MSADENSESTASSEGEDVETTGLIATRQKRATAGNRYASLLAATLDDEDLQKQLFAELEEDADDVAEYEGSDREDDDAAFDSSSDDEDAGPPKEGEAEDLDGEKEVKKAERAEASKKRKAKDARLKIPAWQKKKEKRVKLADDVKTEDGGSERPKKKSERANWMPTAADAPLRQSDRASARANREITHANLKQSYARSEKQRLNMKTAAEREKKGKRLDLTPEERIQKAARVEKETKRAFNTWEIEEAERQRIRDELLAAKRRKVMDGPFVRYWSGSAVWQGGIMKVKRVLSEKKQLEEEKAFEEQNAKNAKSTEVVEHKKAPEGTGPKEIADQENSSRARTDDLSATKDATGAIAIQPSDDPTKKPDEIMTDVPADDAISTQESAKDEQSKEDPSVEPSQPPTDKPEPTPVKDTDASLANSSQDVLPAVQAAQPLPKPGLQTDAEGSVPWLAGIEEYAAMEVEALGSHSFTHVSGYCPSMPAIHGLPSADTISMAPLPPYLPSCPQANRIIASPSQSMAPPPPPPLPVQAQRCLIMLEQFPNLDSTTKQYKRAPRGTAILEPKDVAKIMLPDSYPTFTPDEVKYLTVNKIKRNGRDLPPKQRCAITSWVPKYRDPKTGLAYADMHAYKMIQRILTGGCQWSSMLGAWVGPAYGPVGRPAHGVPEGFTSLVDVKPASTAVSSSSTEPSTSSAAAPSSIVKSEEGPPVSAV